MSEILTDSIKNNKKGNIYIAVDENNSFYEGRYLSNIKFKPSKSLFGKLGLWLINNGFLYEVFKRVPKQSVVVELGPAGGIDFFASRYKMIGVDISYSSLKNIEHKYSTCIQADASKKLPIQDNSVDAVISSFFWEHISSEDKPKILHELHRILKPGGKLIFIYDVETDNSMINLLKKKDVNLYKQLFIEHDGHVGYHTIKFNKQLFENAGFHTIKNKGLEKTLLQSPSVYIKFAQAKGIIKLIGKIGSFLNKKYILHLYLFILRLTDVTTGWVLPGKKARIVISIYKK